MKAVRRRETVLHGVLSIAVLSLVLGTACGDSGASPQAASDETTRGASANVRSEEVQSPSKAVEPWTQIEIVDHYAFRGEVAEDEDLSGIARLSDKLFVIGADEGRVIQVVELSRPAKTLKVIRSIDLVRTGQEIDTEAIAIEDDLCYVIGSHGLSKKQGQRQENRYKIFRVKLDRQTGKPISTDVATLWDALGADPVLGPHFQQPLQRNGVNIEGLAVRRGRLFVGFRSPSLGGYAFVMEVPANDLFAGRLRTDNLLHRLHLGEGLGIREIVAAKAGFLIIAGNAGSDPSQEFTESENYTKDREFSMFLWDGKASEVHRIGSIPDTPGKAEAMVILDESPTEMTVLMLFDGPKGGAPIVYRIR
jgi:hypothetical protein